jgi:hypothetical protein
MIGADRIRSKCIDFDMPLEWGLERKRTYLSEGLVEIRDVIKSSTMKLTKPELKPVEREMVFLTLKDLKKEESKTVKYLENISEKRLSGISDEMIINAKKYPIGDLIEVKKDFACCPFHNDRNPSFFVKNGFGHCFSCGESGDAIDIAMKINNITFKEAVRSLNGHT